MEEDAEDEPAKQFILWFAKTFGPDIPEPEPNPNPDPNPNPSPDSTKVPSWPNPAPAPAPAFAPVRSGMVVKVLTDARFSKARIEGGGYALKVRAMLDARPKGSDVQLANRIWVLRHKREANRADRSEFEAILVPKRAGVGPRLGMTLAGRDVNLYMSVPRQQ